MPASLQAQCGNPKHKGRQPFQSGPPAQCCQGRNEDQLGWMGSLLQTTMRMPLISLTGRRARSALSFSIGTVSFTFDGAACKCHHGFCYIYAPLCCLILGSNACITILQATQTYCLTKYVIAVCTHSSKIVDVSQTKHTPHTCSHYIPALYM